MYVMYLMIFITTSNLEEANRIAHELLKRRLAACVNIIPKVYSSFLWKNELESCEESLLMVKSKLDVFDDLVNVVKSLHSYSVPEIIAIPIKASYSQYLSWIDEVIGK